MQDVMKTNPFELIFNKLEQLQTTVDIISVNLPRKKEEKPANPNELLSLKEVATILKIPVNTARLYISTRNLPAIKPGKEFKIKRVELENWIENVFLVSKELSIIEKENRISNEDTAPDFMRSANHKYLGE